MKLTPLLSLLLVSCTTLEKETTQKENKITPPARQVVGRVASISIPGKFALIQKYGPGKLPGGVLYQSHAIDGTSSSLKPTGERVRDFFAADIISGTPQVGDAVSSFRMESIEKPPPFRPEGEKEETAHQKAP